MAYTNVKETFEKMPTVFDATKAQGINSVVQYIIDGAGRRKLVYRNKGRKLPDRRRHA